MVLLHTLLMSVLFGFHIILSSSSSSLFSPVGLVIGELHAIYSYIIIDFHLHLAWTHNAWRLNITLNPWTHCEHSGRDFDTSDDKNTKIKHAHNIKLA